MVFKKGLTASPYRNSEPTWPSSDYFFVYTNVQDGDVISAETLGEPARDPIGLINKLQEANVNLHADEATIHDEEQWNDFVGSKKDEYPTWEEILEFNDWDEDFERVSIFMMQELPILV